MRTDQIARLHQPKEIDVFRPWHFILHMAGKLLAGVLITMAAQSVWAQSANPPIGNAESAGPSGSSYVTSGWACDPDDYGAGVAIHFYLDGTYATGTFVGAVGAYDYRGDLYGVCGGTAYHGYNFTIPSQYLSQGQHTIYAYALDTGGAGPNPLLGAISFTVGPPPSNAPIGSAEWAGASGSAYATSGWTCDPDNYGAALTVHFYLDGTYSTGTFVGAVGAYDYRGDVVYSCGGTAYHGYNFTIPSQYLTPGQHTIYAYALDSGGAGPNPLLGALTFSVQAGQATYSISGNTGGSSISVAAGGYPPTTSNAAGSYVLSGLPAGTYVVTPSTSDSVCSFSPPSRTVSIGPNASNVNFVETCERSLNSPGFAHARWAFNQCDENDYCYVVPSIPATPYWTASSHNEVPVPASWPTWRLSGTPYPTIQNSFSFSSIGGGKYKLVISLDKINQDFALNAKAGGPLDNADPPHQAQFSTAHTTAFVNDFFAGGTLDEELYLDLTVTWTNYAVASGDRPRPPLGFIESFPYGGFPDVNGMSRITVGVPVSWDGKTNFFEVVLGRDAAYDGCADVSTRNISWWGAMRGTWEQDPNWTCDGLGLFDRRFAVTGVIDVFYFWVTGLAATGQTPSFPAVTPGVTRTYSIPVTKLIKWYYGVYGTRLADNPGPASGWGTASVGAVYLGIESWGKATSSIELRDYRFYSRRGNP